jgi:two-component system NtrC family sensor kinase
MSTKPNLREMQGINKTEEQLIKELEALRQRVAELEKVEAKRKRAEEALRASKAQMQALLDGSPDMIRQLDRNMRIVWANKTALDINPDAIGQTCYKAYLNRDEPCKGCPCMKAMDTGRIETGIMYQPWARATQGESYWEDIGVPLRDSEGKIVGVVEITRNITERKRAEEALQESEEKLRLMFESVTEGITVSDLEGKIVEVNEPVVRMYGADSKDELIGRSSFEFMAEKDHARAMDNLKKTLEEGYSGNIEYTLLRKDGSEYPAELSATVLRDASGNPIGFIAITRDITERKETEEQLIVTDRLASVGELASGIAHELNNPLTSVIGFSQLLLGKDIPDDVKEDVKIIYREAQRTAEVVKNLLTFARKHLPVKQLVNVNSIIGKVLELRAYEQKVSNIQVNTRFAANLPEVMADYFQLQQVFLNIIINAEHFMTEAHGRGILTITTERTDDVVKASFTDDGPGISKENLWHVFDPFFTTKEVGKGTGLGLSICHGIIAEHGGQIYAEGELGKGATFVVELPTSIDREGEWNEKL